MRSAGGFVYTSNFVLRLETKSRQICDKSGNAATSYPFSVLQEYLVIYLFFLLAILLR